MSVNNDKSKMGQQNVDSTVINNFNFSTPIIIGIVILIAVSIFSWIYLSKPEGKIVATNNYTPIFQDTNAYNILLLPFGSSQNCDDENVICEREVESRFNLIKEQDNIKYFEVQVYEAINTKTRSLSYDKARELGESLGADLVVWGDYQNKCEWDSTKIKVKWAAIEMLSEPKFIISNQYTNYQSLDDISRIEEGIVTGNVEEVVYWNLGIREYFNKNYIAALSYFRKLSTRDSQEYAEVYRAMGDCYSFGDTITNKNYNLKKAIKDFSKAIELNPKYANGYKNRGLSYKKIGKKEQARKDFYVSKKLEAKSNDFNEQ